MGTIASLVKQSKVKIAYDKPLLAEEVTYAEIPPPTPAEIAALDVALNRYLTNLPPEKEPEKKKQKKNSEVVKYTEYNREEGQELTADQQFRYGQQKYARYA
ncbi:hypothetical protein TrLO_g2551 [Triparma laevis f. longispina]|uniref:Uncharacterized protein n=1 Tax=Triparma laevis f. longispina TaxID=1714387 RepID=A0A9W6Z779_9STRA|nr:hypothetical protein TrLO_g2551 [Triparma laevis f. longispina]